MYNLVLKIDGNGTINYKGAIKLGTEGEFGSTRLVFEVDDSVEGDIRYVKFVHGDASYLEKINLDNTLIIPDGVFTYKGRWFISFISSKGEIENNVVTGDYAFITEPHEAYVADGILDVNLVSKEEKILVGLIEGSLSVVDFPTSVKKIGSFFLAQCSYSPTIKIGFGIKTIESHAFEDGKYNALVFKSDTNLVTIGDYVFQRSTFVNGDVKIPNTVKSWGRNVFGSTTLSSLTFEEGSGITSFPTYAFYGISGIESLEIPHGVKGFSGNGQTISSCDNLKKIIIPSSFDIPIQSNHISNCSSLTCIELGHDFNVSINVSNCLQLTKEALVAMFKALKDRTSEEPLNIVVGSVNLAKLEDSNIEIAKNKNWTVS